MTEFETQNTVDVVIDDRSLTEARADVEEALSSVPMDVQAEVSGGAGGGGSEVAARDRARQRQLLTDQTSSINELRETFEEGDTMSEWQEEHDLSRERNRLLEQLVDAREEGNFDRAARAGGGLLGGGAAILGAGAILGVGALSSVLSNFSWPSLPEFSWPDLPDLKPPGPPGWVPIDVNEPGEIPVQEPGEATIEDPTSEYPVAEPSPAEYPVEEPASEYPVEDPSDIQVQKPSWVPLDVRSPEASGEGGGGSNEGIIAALAGAGAIGGGAFLGREFLKRGGQTALRAGSSAGAGMFLTPEAIGITDHEKMNSRRRTFNRYTPDFMNMEMMKESEEHPGSVFSAEGRQAQVEGMRDVAKMIKQAIRDVRDVDTADTKSSDSTQINTQPNISVETKGVTRRELDKAMEQAKKEALRELNREIQGNVR